MAEVTAIFLHSEGILAHASLRSMIEAKAAAEVEGVRVELLVIADCPRSGTRDYLGIAQGLGARVMEVDVDDLGLARNAAVAVCTTRFLAFLDGDDLWAPRWLVRAHAAAMREPRDVLWHPEASLYFRTSTSSVQSNASRHGRRGGRLDCTCAVQLMDVSDLRIARHLLARTVSLNQPTRWTWLRGLVLECRDDRQWNSA